MKVNGGVANTRHLGCFGDLSLGQYVSGFPIRNVSPHLCIRCLKTVTVSSIAKLVLAVSLVV